MAVSIDTVYQRVLAIANKEQRGYITPQEFNLLANQAQMDLFEQYFFDLKQFLQQPGNDTTHGDPIDIIKEKIDIFERSSQNGMGTLPLYYRLGELYFFHAECTGGARFIEIEKMNQNEVHHIINSPLTAPNLNQPVYVRTRGVVPNDASDQAQTSTTANEISLSRSIQVYPTTITSNVVCNYIARPAQVNWGYTVVNEQALYNSATTVDFELHQSEEVNLIFKILALAGVIIKDPQMYQIANTETQNDIQEEKL
jgi:hypothetical protein